MSRLDCVAENARNDAQSSHHDPIPLLQYCAFDLSISTEIAVVLSMFDPQQALRYGVLHTFSTKRYSIHVQ